MAPKKEVFSFGIAQGGVDLLSSIVLGVVVTLFTLAVLRGRDVPFSSTDRGAFFTLALLGFFMCSLAFPLRSPAPSWNWLNPLVIIAMLLGGLAVVLVIAVLFRFPLPLIASERQAFIAMAAIIAAKFITGHVRMLLA